MRQLDLSRAVWRKSSRSNEQGGDCVEVALSRGCAAVRDSKNADGPVFSVPARAWQTFLRSL